MAVQEGLTSVRVSWSPPSPLGGTTGYRISYSGGSSGSVDVSDGSTSTHTLTGLVNGASSSYTISIVGTSLHLPSNSIQVMNLGLGKYIISGAYEPPKAARSVQLRIIAQNGVCIYSST